jgi:hypothetical protein
MAYRDDTEAQAARCAELERQLAEIDSHSAQLAELKRAEPSLRRELSAMRSMLNQKTLPVLDDIRVASPCSADWDQMTGDSRARFCGQCNKNVYNLSGMTRAEAEAVVREKEGNLCVRYYRRADGTLLTADCPVGLRHARFRRRTVAGVGAGILVAGALWAAASVFTMGAPARTMGAPPPPPLTQIKGDVAR